MLMMMYKEARLAQDDNIVDNPCSEETSIGKNDQQYTDGTCDTQGLHDNAYHNDT